jgi:hypothetical protein
MMKEEQHLDPVPASSSKSDETGRTIMTQQMKQRLATGPERYGRCYWCVKTKLSKEGEIYLYADRVEFTASGSERPRAACGTGKATLRRKAR